MKITKELIHRYHAGQCNEVERLEVEQWLESDEAEISFPKEADLNVMEERGWKKISGRYSIGIQSKDSSPANVHNYLLIWQVAACVVLVLCTAMFFYLNANSGGKSSQSMVQVYREVKAAKGQKLTVTLPDGTLVQLNSESALRFPEKFGSASRQVQFKGEAFFKVVKDPLKPFFIHTATTQVRVLGTRFNLRAYPSEKLTSVVVDEGQVSFSAKIAKDSLILTANQQGIYVNGSAMQRKEVSATKFISWKDNQLVFDDLPLAQITETLERWYGVKIVIKNTAIMDQRYTGRFNQPDLKTVLESMAFAIKFNVHQKNKTYTIY